MINRPEKKNHLIPINESKMIKPNPYKNGEVSKFSCSSCNRGSLAFYLSIYHKIAMNLRIAHDGQTIQSQENPSVGLLYWASLWDAQLALLTYDSFIPTNANVRWENLQVLEPAKSVHSDMCKWHTMHPLFRAARIHIMWIWVRAREQFPRGKDARPLIDKHKTGSHACKIKLCGRIMAIHLWNNAALRANKLVLCNASIFATLLWRQNLH